MSDRQEETPQQRPERVAAPRPEPPRPAPEHDEHPVPGVKHEPEPDAENIIPAEDRPGTF